MAGLQELHSGTTLSRLFVIAVAMCGAVGAVVLVASFAINPAPPAKFNTSQLRDFALQHHNLIGFGACLQGMGTLLLVLFAVALAHLAGALVRFAGWITCWLAPPSWW